MKKLLLILLCALAAPLIRAQAIDDTTAPTGVMVHTDPRLSIVSAARKSHNAARKTYASSSSTVAGRPGGRKAGTIRSAKGFRVQIYSGNDRARAMQVKSDFVRRYPSVRSYMTYIAPTFRIKVGDFQSRGDAADFLHRINSAYSPVMIVPDQVVINTFRDN